MYPSPVLQPISTTADERHTCFRTWPYRKNVYPDAIKVILLVRRTSGETTNSHMPDNLKHYSKAWDADGAEDGTADQHEEGFGPGVGLEDAGPAGDSREVWSARCGMVLSGFGVR